MRSASRCATPACRCWSGSLPGAWRGATPATTGGDGRTVPCAACHGAELEGGESAVVEQLCVDDLVALAAWLGARPGPQPAGLTDSRPRPRSDRNGLRCARIACRTYGGVHLRARSFAPRPSRHLRALALRIDGSAEAADATALRGCLCIRDTFSVRVRVCDAPGQKAGVSEPDPSLRDDG